MPGDHNVPLQAKKPKHKHLLRRPQNASTDRLQLLDEIENALQPYLKSNKKPEISIPELFVISLLFKPDATMGAALRWAVGNIPYYRNRALDDFTSDNMGPRQALKFSEHFYSEWELLPDKLHMPISASRAEGASYRQTVYNAIPNESRFFLAKVLHRLLDSEEQDSSPVPDPPRRRKPFPFMRLPAELRVNVYQLVLGFPKSGIRLLQDHAWLTEPRVHVAKREMDDPDKSLWHEMIEGNSAVWTLRGHKLSRYLSLFRVSKQVYAESMPVFYAINHFACTSMKDLYDLLRLTPVARREHIRSITFPLMIPRRMQGSMGEMTKACRMLKHIPGLRELEIHINEDSFKLAMYGTGIPRYPDVLNIKPIKILRTVRGLQKVDFLGSCDDVRGALGPEMIKPAPEKTMPARKKRATVKRKAEDGDEKQKSSGASKRKKDGKKAKVS